MYGTFTQRELVCLLETLLNDTAERHLYRMSLCYVVDHECHIVKGLPRSETLHTRQWMERHWTRWPGYSRDEVYPVPSTRSGQTPRDAYLENNGTTGMWFGEYGTKRRDLAAFLIAQWKAETPAWKP